MTEANLRLSWTSYQLHNMYKSGKFCTQFPENFILLRLVKPTSVTVQQDMYTTWWKARCTLILVAKDAWYCLHLLHRSLTDYARNLWKSKYALCMDSKPYIKPSKGCLILPSLVTEFNETRLCDSVHNGRKTSKAYTLIILVKHAFTILYTMLGKPPIHLRSLREQTFMFLQFLCNVRSNFM